MDCDIILNVGGKKYNLGSTDKPIKDINEIKKLLSGRSLDELKEVLETLPKFDSIENIELTNINENSVGLFSPAELIKDKNVIRLTQGLSIPKDAWSSKMVIAGIANENVKTQFYKGHIFLNLNYAYDEQNKIMALTELALYLNDADKYADNSETLRTGTDAQRTNILNNIIKSGFGDKAKLLSKLLFIYNEASYKNTIDVNGESDKVNTRDSAYSVKSNFETKLLKENRDYYYQPAEKTPIKNLKQGDLVGVKFDNKTIYEIFFDYKVDTDGNKVITTISGGEELTTRKSLITSDYIYARKSDDTTIKPVYKVTKNQSELSINKFSKVSWNTVLDLVKSGKVKVKIGRSKTYREISEINGSIVTVNGEQTPISEIKNFLIGTDVDTTSFKTHNEEDIKNNTAWQPVQYGVMNGAHVLIKEDNKLVDAIVLAHGTSQSDTGGKKIVYYLTKDNTVKYLMETSIKYVTSPSIDHVISVTEKVDVKQTIGNIFNTDSNGRILNNIQQTFLSPKKNTPNAFKTSAYSVEQMSSHTLIEKGDFMYDSLNGTVLKVLESAIDHIKTSGDFGGINRYIDIETSDLNLSRYLLLSNKSQNTAFAQGWIVKNRFKLGNTPDLANASSQEVKVYQSKNGYVYSRPISESKYESSDIDITNIYKESLKDRYKWSSIPEKLYMYEGNTINGKKAILKDDFNTNRISLNDTSFDKVFQYVVPGSYLLVEGNAKPFIVEKTIGDKLLVSSYHYSDIPNVGDTSKINHVKAERFLIGIDAKNIKQLFIPKWATDNFDKLKEVTIQSDAVKSSYVTAYTKSDSVEVINAMIEVLQNKFGIPINIITNDDLKDFAHLNVANSAAFVYEGGVYVNVDKAGMEEPLHEILHLVLATMKSTEPDSYYQIVNSVQYHPMFDEISKSYSGDVNTDKLEETFVKLLTMTVKNNIKPDELFTEQSFNEAIKKGISNLLDLTSRLDMEDSLYLLEQPIDSLMTQFGSKLIGAEDGLIDTKNAFEMFNVSGKIKQLIKNDQLIQDCSY